MYHLKSDIRCLETSDNTKCYKRLASTADGSAGTLYRPVRFRTLESSLWDVDVVFVFLKTKSSVGRLAMVKQVYEFLWNKGVRLRTPKGFRMYRGWSGGWVAISVVTYSDDIEWED